MFTCQSSVGYKLDFADIIINPLLHLVLTEALVDGSLDHEDVLGVEGGGPGGQLATQPLVVRHQREPVRRTETQYFYNTIFTKLLKYFYENTEIFL